MWRMTMNEKAACFSLEAGEAWVLLALREPFERRNSARCGFYRRSWRSLSLEFRFSWDTFGAIA